VFNERGRVVGRRWVDDETIMSQVCKVSIEDWISTETGCIIIFSGRENDLGTWCDVHITSQQAMPIAPIGANYEQKYKICRQKSKIYLEKTFQHL